MRDFRGDQSTSNKCPTPEQGYADEFQISSNWDFIHGIQNLEEMQKLTSLHENQELVVLRLREQLFPSPGNVCRAR